jgi:dolichol kinase
MAPAPLTLALGVLVSLWCMPPAVGMACILIAAIADSVAAVVGERWGRVPWRYNPLKSVEGSAAFFVTAVACAAVYLPLTGALTVAAVATALESLPLQDWDNFVTPVGTGIFVVAIGF